MLGTVTANCLHASSGFVFCSSAPNHDQKYTFYFCQERVETRFLTKAMILVRSRLCNMYCSCCLIYSKSAHTKWIKWIITTSPYLSLAICNSIYEYNVQIFKKSDRVSKWWKYSSKLNIEETYLFGNLYELVRGYKTFNGSFRLNVELFHVKNINRYKIHVLLIYIDNFIKKLAHRGMI